MFRVQTPQATVEYPVTTPGWPKWLPSDPTSPRWYDVDALMNLIAAYLTHERTGGRVRTIREFVAEFYGLSASAKQKAVLEVAELPRRYLHDLIEGDVLCENKIARLLEAMCAHAKPVNPKAL